MVVSPPSRAAWIEIADGGHGCPDAVSPPSRAAWIEMPDAMAPCGNVRSRRLHGRRGLKYERK